MPPASLCAPAETLALHSSVYYIALYECNKDSLKWNCEKIRTGGSRRFPAADREKPSSRPPPAVPGAGIWPVEHGRTRGSRRRCPADALQPVRQQGGNLPGDAPQGVGATSRIAFPPGIETQGDVEDVLRLIARMILELHRHAEYLGFLRMVVADSRQFPWIAEEFAAVMDPQTERLARYLAHMTAMGLLDAAIRAGSSPVHGDAQRVLALALDDGPRTPRRPGRGRGRRDDQDVPSALPPPAVG